MCVCVYICIYIYTDITTRVFSLIRNNYSLSTYIYIYIHIRTYTCIHAYTYAHVYTHVRTYTFIHAYTYVDIHAYTYTHLDRVRNPERVWSEKVRRRTFWITPAVQEAGKIMKYISNTELPVCTYTHGYTCIQVVSRAY